MHRKVHLFDIDIPGKIKFKVRKQQMRRKIVTRLLQESETLTSGSNLNSFDTGVQ
jgi:hypothetical protein